MITSKRSQIGKLLHDNPDMIIHNSWNHEDKSKETQQKELDASLGLIQYAKVKDKWFLFLSTCVEVTSGNQFYVKAKLAVEKIIISNLTKYTIIRFPTLLAKGTVFEKFWTKEYTEAQGNVVKFGLIREAVGLINHFIDNPKCGTFDFPETYIWKMSDRLIKELADFYQGLCLVPTPPGPLGYHDVDKYYPPNKEVKSG